MFPYVNPSGSFPGKLLVAAMIAPTTPSKEHAKIPHRFSDLPTTLDWVVGKNSSKQMCMTKTGWCCCVTRPHFSPHASSNRAVCS